MAEHKILAVMQNQWFKDPDRMRAILARGLAKGLKRHDFIARTLFMGCRTGLVLKQVFGVDLCRRIIWEEASPEIGDFASASFPADSVHLQKILEDINPDVVLAFGRIATDGLAPLVPPEMLIIGPHPVARGAATLPKLISMKKCLLEVIDNAKN